jgi:lipopolysaccharide/colanic/teichoic acid biosynthesis glycosyltransferase
MSSAVDLLPVPVSAPLCHKRPAEPVPAVRASDDGSLAWWKSCFDLSVSAVLLVLTAPLVLLAAVAVRLTSEGPAFYSQVRVGANGRRFVIWKLRSMYHNCEAASGIRWATKGDKRVTSVGRFLRATHIDELPQLWNVIRGDMSLVGPRPERPEIAAGLVGVIPSYDERHRVKPGLTGLSQILLPPDSDLESTRRKVAMDLRYLDGFGPWLELRVLVGTVLHLANVPGWLVARVLRLPTPTPTTAGGA